MNVKEASLKNIGSSILNAASDLLSNSDFISRTIGMTSSYDDIMFIVQSLEREPISLFGFLVIRRIIAADTSNGYKGLKDQDSFNFETFIKYFREIDIRELVQTLTDVAFNRIDGEAEACLIACEIIIDKFNGDERSIDELLENYITNFKKDNKNEGTSSDNTDA